MRRRLEQTEAKRPEAHRDDEFDQYEQQEDLGSRALDVGVVGEIDPEEDRTFDQHAE